jgi:hypothetical protein
LIFALSLVDERLGLELAAAEEGVLNMVLGSVAEHSSGVEEQLVRDWI